MIFTEFVWNTILATPLRLPLVFAGSVRCAHSFDGGEMIGRCDVDVALPDPKTYDRNKIYVRNTVNRGPLLLRARGAQELVFFDEVNYILGEDDHDLMKRSKYKKWVVGFYPVGFYSPHRYAATRNIKKFAAAVDDETKKRDKLYFQNRVRHSKPSKIANAPSVAKSLLIFKFIHPVRFKLDYLDTSNLHLFFDSEV